MNNLDKIEQYYNNTLTAVERAVFEAELKSNPDMAAEVAFYVQAKQAAQAEAHARRKAEWKALGQSVTQTQQRTRFYTYAAAASVVLVIASLFYYSLNHSFTHSPIDKVWASAYIEKNFATLTTQMSSTADSLQMGISAYNAGDLEKAQVIFGELLKRDSLDTTAEEYAGIVSLRRGDYDQAIKHFHRLSTRTDLVANPGKFYEALALLSRNRPLDKSKAENLLKEVKADKLEGWKEVE